MKYLRKLRSSFCLLLLFLSLPGLCFAAADGSNPFSAVDATKANSIDGIINPESFTNLSPEDYVKNPSELTEADRQILEKFLRLPTQHILEIMYLLQGHYKKVVSEQEKIGTNELLNKIERRQNSDSVEFEAHNVGKAEPIIFRHNDQSLLFTKVRHNGLKRIFFFIDLDQVKLDMIERPPSPDLTQEQYKEELRDRRAISSYVRKLTARMILQNWERHTYTPLSESLNTATLPEDINRKVQEIMHDTAESLEAKSWFQNIKKRAANLTLQIESDRLAKGGWDVMLVGYSSSKNEVLAEQVVTKPKVFQNRGSISKTAKGSIVDTFKLWKMHWLNIWETPEYDQKKWESYKGIEHFKILLHGDYFNGLYWGAKLSGISFITTLVLQQMLPMGLSPVDVALNSFGFSVFFGVFSKSWARFTFHSSDFSRFIKNLLPGYFQTYSMFMMSEANLMPIRKGQLDAEAMRIHTNTAINQGLKSDSKNGLQEAARDRFIRGEAQGKVVFRYPKIRMPSKELPIMEFEIIDRQVRIPGVGRPNVTDANVIRDLRNANETAKSDITLTLKDVKIKIPWITIESWESDISRKSFESQSVQNITTPAGLPSRFGLTIDVFGIPVPVGHIIYASLGPAGKYYALKQKEKYLAQLIESHGPNHPETIRQSEDTELARQSWQRMRLLGIPYTQVIGYYPSVLWSSVKSLSQWTFDKALVSGYRFFRASSQALTEIENHNRSTTEASEVMRRIMLVRNDAGQIHPQQVANELLRQSRTESGANDGVLLCKGLFN